ncbi:MAG TPA: SDR family oxidoreductase [Mycobacteriales bacterium]|jgi:3-oxoacyl-[acyl-carrier protein] reductase
MSTNADSLRGRVALVTGAGRGIGQAVARGLAARGANVAVLARSTEQVIDTVTSISALACARRGDAVAVPADVADSDQVSDALKWIEHRWGSVDILINNAGVVSPLGASTSINPDEWARAMTVNVTAAARLTFTVLPAMLTAGWGRIVNVSSGIAANPAGMLRANAYATSKAALESHTLNLAAELAETGVTVNVYRPGSVDTAMQAYIRYQDPDRIGTALHERFVTRHAAGTLLSAEQTATSLLSRIGGQATGQIWDAGDPLANDNT